MIQKPNKLKSFLLDQNNLDGSFNFSPSNKISNLYATCFGIMSLELINDLQHFKHKNKTVKIIQKYQDKNTGFFLDKSCIPDIKTNHNLEYISLQLTDFAQLALSTMKSRPNYDYKFLKKYKSTKYLKQWFFDLNWENPWLVSNIVMFVMNCFIHENQQKNKKYIYLIIELLNATQEKKTGFWNMGGSASLHNQMAGAYHFLFFYTYLNIKPNYIKKIIDSTLLIQNYDGLFNYASGGGSCDDLDAVDLLCRSTFYTNYRRNDIEKALKKTYLRLLENQNIDGGFCWAKRDKNIFNLALSIFDLNLLKKAGFSEYRLHAYSKFKRITSICLNQDGFWKYSGLNSMLLKTNESDLFSTWFRLTSLAFIEKTFPTINEGQPLFNWKLRKKSGLGFYKK